MVVNNVSRELDNASPKVTDASPKLNNNQKVQPIQQAALLIVSIVYRLVI